MIYTRLSFIVSLSFSSLIFAAKDSVYCPQGHSNISLGMTKAAVMNACGKPTSQFTSNDEIMEKVPMNQLIYNNEGATTAFYGVWAIPAGFTQKPSDVIQPFGGNSGGSKLEVNIVKDKVYSISLNGSSTEAFSICNGNQISVGDDAGSVTGACGNPSLVNETFIFQPIPMNSKPEKWIYAAGPYQPTIHLTFVDGKLQSIE